MVENRKQLNETSPLLQRQESQQRESGKKKLSFSNKDPANPRVWTNRKKLGNIAVIASMAVFSPLASSMFAPGIDKIAKSLDVDRDSIIACQTGYVIMIGVGPLFLAPLSETFGRKKLYLICFACFALLQIPTALAKNLPTLVALRTITGFFGSESLRCSVIHHTDIV